jgi:hypothetical protein
MAANLQKVFKSGNFYIRYFWFTFVFMNNMVSHSYERRVIPDIEIREAVINACGLRSIADFQLLTLERRKSNLFKRLCFLSMPGQDNSPELLA